MPSISLRTQGTKKRPEVVESDLEIRKIEQKLREISIFESRTMRTESEIQNLPKLLTFLEEKLVYINKKKIEKVLTEGITTYKKVTALNEIKENRNEEASAGIFKPQLFNHIEDRKHLEHRILHMSQKLHAMNHLFFNTSSPLYHLDVRLKEENDMWKYANAISDDMLVLKQI